LFLTACAELQRPTSESFLSKTAPPARQEFRWSNGKKPKSLDPAQAIAAPETDIVRAIFEGLTELDPKSLDVIPAVATKWTSSDDFRTWTFSIRQRAKWSNGKRVTARDFVRSWQRLLQTEIGSQQGSLVSNIVGFETKSPQLVVIAETKKLPPRKTSETANAKANQVEDSIEYRLPISPKSIPSESPDEVPPPPEKPSAKKIGVEALDENTLQVSLVQPDKDFPSLVAHPVFRPVFDGGSEYAKEELSANITTNGAFRVASIDRNGITLDRSEHYWNREDVLLERARFVAAESSDSVLAAYKAGEIDAITNADFEPLALKLFDPFVDFRRTRHGALNFYEFNLRKAPFTDSRVREALSTSVDRERLTNDEMDGASSAARRFLPFLPDARIRENDSYARELLAKAGFDGGKNFPVVKLLINRNDVQRRIARAVSQMWKTKLNVETEIVEMEQKEVESARATGDFDVVRRGVVFSTADEMVNIVSMFGGSVTLREKRANTAVTADESNIQTPAGDQNANVESNANILVGQDDTAAMRFGEDRSVTILTEAQALEIIPAIPLYFPFSYSLVKPYVKGFDSNVLDAMNLHGVSIDHDWKPESASRNATSAN
jgi:oligopeptide transport system substrate-binding protein